MIGEIKSGQRTELPTGMLLGTLLVGVAMRMAVHMRDDGELGKLLQTRFRANPQSKEWKTADRELRKIDDRQRKRAPHDRHKQRMRAIYVEPDDSGTRWNRPRDVGQRSAYDFLMHAANDYAGQLQRVEQDFLRGSMTHCYKS